MPNIKSAKKRLKQDAVRRERNRAGKSALRTQVKKFRAAVAKLRRNRLLVFSRWCQVMFRFEAALYADPN